MAGRLGIIAGSGDFPIHVLKEAKKQDYFCALIAIDEDYPVEWSGIADVAFHVELSKITEMIAFLRTHRIDQVIMAGKIDPRRGLEEIRQSPLLMKLTAGLRDRRPAGLIAMAVEYFEKQGIKVIDPSFFISELMCGPGVLTGGEVPAEIRDEIEFGWPIARAAADLDIGQTLIVKDKKVVAVEGLEGTDETIRRGGRLAGSGIVAIKLCRSRQDTRIDLPAVGADTVKSLIDAGGGTLCFESRKMPFFQREEALRLADAHGIVIVSHEA